MVVSVSFNGIQRKVTRTDKIQIPVSEKTRVIDVLRYIQECYPDVSLSRETVFVMVNNKVSALNQTLKADDTVLFLPYIGGG